MTSKFDCTIVILSYNSLAVTDACLTRLETAIKSCQNTLKNTVKVIVVDNASTDGSVAMIRRKHPSVKLIANRQNIWYAAGNNVALKQADTPYLLLMNSDTYVHPDSLVKIISLLATKSADCDILVGRAVYANGGLQLYGGYLPTPLRIILWSLGCESLPVIKNFLHRIYGFNPDYYNHEGIMEWCPPVFMLLKKQVYDQVGGFDENLSFHMVDAEWCHRIHAQGFRIRFTPTVEVIHLGGASSKDIQDKLVINNFKGLMHFCRKHYPDQLKLVVFCLRIGLRARGLLYSLFGRTALAATYAEIVREVTVQNLTSATIPGSSISFSGKSTST